MSEHYTVCLELSSADSDTTIMTMGAGDIYKVADALVVRK